MSPLVLTKRRTTLLVVTLAVSCAIVVFNSLHMMSPVIGLLSSIVFWSSLGIVCGEVFYDQDAFVLKVIKGWFTAILILTITGSLLLYLDAFNVLVSGLMVVFITALFLAFLLGKLHLRSRADKLSAQEVNHLSVGGFGILLSGILVAIVLTCFYILLASRTLEPMFDVWHTIPETTFLSLIFLSVLTLICLIFFRRSSPLYLVLIIFLGFLFLSIYYLVWYPSIYGDPLNQLGAARYVAGTGAVYARDYLLSHGYWLDIVKYRGYYVLVVLFTRLLSFDIYWVHNVTIPLLWAFVLPLSAYEVTTLLIDKPSREYPKEAMLAAFCGIFFVRKLIGWGANPTPNTLSFLFLFFTVPLILRWVKTGGKVLLGLALLGGAATAMTHPLPGVSSVAFLFVAVVFRKIKSAGIKIVMISCSVLFYPLIVLAYGHQLQLMNLLSIQNFIEFEETLITVPLIIAAIGFFLSIRRRSLNRNSASLMFTFFVLTVVEYYVGKFAAPTMPYSAERILPISDFLLVPFMALFFNSLPEVVAESKHLKKAVTSKMSNVKPSINAKIVASVVLCLVISLQSVVTLYQAYPRNEVGLAPTAYEAEAVYYINSTGPRRFVVLSDVLFANLAIGLLGQDYSYIGRSGGAFGLSEWDYPIQVLYVEMAQNPSVDVLESALEFASAQVAYFVVSTRLSYLEDVVYKTSQIVPVEKVFFDENGDKEIYVFRYPTPAFEGFGPKITVIYDDGAVVEEVQSKFSYTVKSKVSYSANLTGHRSYNITNYPKNWVFKSLFINLLPRAFDNSSDINSFVLVKGLNPTDYVEVVWSANDYYPVCGWKEDSFKVGWGPYPKYSYPLKPIIISDGDILTLYGNFTREHDIEDYYYAKPCNITTDDYTHVIIKWKSSTRIAVSAVYFESGAQEIMEFGSHSYNWTTTMVELPPGKTITYVMVGISNYLPPPQVPQPISGIQIMSVDYILICAEAS